jgi:hypothetical protein
MVRFLRREVHSVFDPVRWQEELGTVRLYSSSLLLSGDDLRLAPFYDTASALPYDNMPIQKLRLAIKLGRPLRAEDDAVAERAKARARRLE